MVMFFFDNVLSSSFSSKFNYLRKIIRKLSFKIRYSTIIVYLSCAIILLPDFRNIAYTLIVFLYISLIFKKSKMNQLDLILVSIFMFIVFKQVLYYIYYTEYDLTATVKYLSYPIIMMGAQRISLGPLHIQLVKFTTIILLFVGAAQYALDLLGFVKLREIAPKGTTSSANVTAVVLLNLILLLSSENKVKSLIDKITIMLFLVYKSAATIPAVFVAVFAIRSRFTVVALVGIGVLSTNFLMQRIKLDLFADFKIVTVLDVLGNSNGVGLGSLFWRVWAWLSYIKDPTIFELLLGYSLGATSKVSPMFQFEMVGQDPHNSIIIIIYEFGLVFGSMMAYLMWRYGYLATCRRLSSRWLLPSLIFLVLFFGNAFASKEFLISFGFLLASNVKRCRKSHR
jgi:hypothetical protein